MAMADQQNIFNQRLARINKGTGPNLMGQTLIGAADTSKRASKGKTGKGLQLSQSQAMAVKKPLIQRMLGMPLALLMGAGAVLTANVALFQMYSAGRTPFIALPETLTTALQSANGPLWAAIGVAALVVLLFQIFTPARLMAFAVGFGAMFVGEAQFETQFPTVWTALYAPQIVQPAETQLAEGEILPTEDTVAVTTAQSF
ncbi:hypothetical protein [Thalassobius sp. I31.1]|uniref:hypothetical protein n=1 Tax=Thalassobius sp. I31.1 TaxID=2109912 RepID=UPI000D1B0928|nr:hypothetical protein [Thalassobius sp. I31.1]